MPVTGPETEVFADIARQYQLRIMLGMLERDKDAVYNSAVLTNPNGQIDGLSAFSCWWRDRKRNFAR